LVIMMSENEFFAVEFDDVDEPLESIRFIPPEAWGAMAYFKSRKRRPQERWRKKREKGKRKPSELFFLKRFTTNRRLRIGYDTRSLFDVHKKDGLV